MTAAQLALPLGDCDPQWADAAAELHDPIDLRWRDLRHQRIKPQQYARIVDVQVVGDYL